MALTLEWRHRIQRWREELPRHFYRPLGEVALEGFVTLEQLTAEEALTRSFSPMPPGTRWGAKWEYGWFRGDLALPESAAGQRVVLAVDVGAESLVFVNGSAAGARDRQHTEITLATAAVPGTAYTILIEGYAGHGPQVVTTGPTPPDRETVPEPPLTQATVGESTFGIWEEDVYQLWLDVETLWQLRENLDPESLRVAEIDAGLRDLTLIVDFELPHGAFLETARAARGRLAGLLACVNGSTAPEMYGFGHSHIDVAWLWPLAETERKTGRTFSTQLALMEQYPEFKFLQSQPHLFRMVKQRYPELYERIKAAAAAGQFVVEGGSWVEPDTNISGGEALIRQFVHGKRFYEEEFGVTCELLWLPDVFGYSGALPQLMRGCGLKYFSTQKIFWAYNGGDPFPYNTFIWEGIDGSEVYVHLHNDYNARVDPQSLIQRWRERVQKDGIATRLYPFGYGDGGGGPTRNHLEFARRLADLEGAPRFRMAHPLAFFHDQEARGWPEARYVGELYFQAHRGVLTSQAKTKRGNRKSELALRRAELWGVAGRALAGFAFSPTTLEEAWKTVLLNQFHDILPGSSIARVYEEAEASYADVIAQADAVAQDAAASLTSRAEAVTVFNDLSWERVALVALPETFQGAIDGSGEALPVQVTQAGRLVEVRLPSCGWRALRPGAALTVDNSLKATPTSLENALLKLTFNDKGEIISLVDKQADVGEVAAGPCNSFRMYKDVPSSFDAWDIDSQYELTPVPLDAPASIEVVAAGPLVATLRITRPLHDSTMVQEVSLRRDSRRVDFKTTVEWRERHKLLKVAFPVNVHANEALHEIQFGHIRRPNHRSRPFDADRFEVANHKWTALAQGNRVCAVLNDSKYGVNVLDNTINLTLLKSALAPDMRADLGTQEFSYAFYVENGCFEESDVVRQGYELNCPTLTVSGDGGVASLFALDSPNVIIDTVKPAEDGSPDVVLRLYESKQMTSHCTLSTSLPVGAADATDMLESTVVEPLRVEDGRIRLAFRPFEVKTVRLRLA